MNNSNQVNIQYIHKECSTQRWKEWQQNNKHTVISPGDSVKIGFVFDNKNESLKEWLWINIDQISKNGTTLIGTVDNIPIHLSDVEYKQTVIFYRDQIVEHIKT